MDNKIPKELATPSGIDHKGCLEITAALNPLVADALALYVKVKSFHWHVSGSHFRDYHLLFDEQAEQIFAMVDPLAERARKLGGTTIRSIGHIASLQTIKDDEKEFVEAHKMIEILLHDNQKYAELLRKAHKVCEKHEDVATCSVLEVFLDETERRIWFLFETTRRA